MLGITLALCAGCCAAMASSFAKIAMSPAIIHMFVCDNAVFTINGKTDNKYCEWVCILPACGWFCITLLSYSLL